MEASLTCARFDGLSSKQEHSDVMTLGLQALNMALNCYYNDHIKLSRWHNELRGEIWAVRLHGLWGRHVWSDNLVTCLQNKKSLCGYKQHPNYTNSSPKPENTLVPGLAINMFAGPLETDCCCLLMHIKMNHCSYQMSLFLQQFSCWILTEYDKNTI